MRKRLVGAAFIALAICGPAEAKGSRLGYGGHGLSRSHVRGGGVKTESAQEVLKRRDDWMDRIHAGRALRERHPRQTYGDFKDTGSIFAPTPAALTTTTAANTRMAKLGSSSEVAGRPAGATAQCRDGSFSTAASHSGACSRHGGVASFLQ